MDMIPSYVTIAWLLTITAIIGNGLVIYLIIITKQLHTTTNWFILSLAAADLSFAVCFFPRDVFLWNNFRLRQRSPWHNCGAIRYHRHCKSLCNGYRQIYRHRNSIQIRSYYEQKTSSPTHWLRLGSTPSSISTTKLIHALCRRNWEHSPIIPSHIQCSLWDIALRLSLKCDGENSGHIKTSLPTDCNNACAIAF